jgi:hypothetical protein
MDLLTTENNFFKNNVLEIAKFSECKKFISHSMVQNLLTTLWYGSSYHKASLIDNSLSQRFTVIKFKSYFKLKSFFHILKMY